MTNETYGPPIPVNGKRPDWLKDRDECQVNLERKNGWSTRCYAQVWHWPDVTKLRLKSDHPYYQSAEYKASVAPLPSGFGHMPSDEELPPLWALDQAARCSHGLNWAASQLYMTTGSAVYGSIVAHARTLAEHVAPPDPLAADREFLAGLEEATKATAYEPFMWRGAGVSDDTVRAAMEYLRQNKERL